MIAHFLSYFRTLGMNATMYFSHKKFSFSTWPTALCLFETSLNVGSLFSPCHQLLRTHRCWFFWVLIALQIFKVDYFICVITIYIRYKSYSCVLQIFLWMLHFTFYTYFIYFKSSFIISYWALVSFCSYVNDTLNYK